MSDAYQAIYDATRSKIQGCDIGSAVENAIRDMNLSFYFENAMSAVSQAASCHEEPSAIYRPKIYMDGDQWCALYGDNLQDGVAGFGDSPALAMNNFNRNWNAKLTALKSATPADKGNAPAEAIPDGAILAMDHVSAYGVIVDGAWHGQFKHESDALASGFETRKRFDLVPLHIPFNFAPAKDQA